METPLLHCFACGNKYWRKIIEECKFIFFVKIVKKLQFIDFVYKRESQICWKTCNTLVGHLFGQAKLSDFALGGHVVQDKTSNGSKEYSIKNVFAHVTQFTYRRYVPYISECDAVTRESFEQNKLSKHYVVQH